MGRVYAPELIASDRLPDEGSHTLAARFILDELFESDPTLVDAQEKEVDYQISDERNYFDIPSGMVYGSVAMGTANRRSDVDLLINYYEDEAGTALPIIRRVLTAAEVKFNIVTEANVLPVGALFGTHRHNVDLLFGEHLLAVQAMDDPRWSYFWPADGLRCRRVDFGDSERLRAIALRYASGKARQFDKSLVCYRDTPDLATLQRAFELPGALGRKLLAATSGSEVPDIVVSGNRSASTESMFEKLNGSTWPDLDHYVSVAEIVKLIDRDKEYSALLEAAYHGDITTPQYADWLNRHYLESITLARRVSQGWSEILRLNLDIRNYAEELKEAVLEDSEDY